MPHPAWVAEAFAAALVVVGGYCLARLVAAAPLGRRTHVDVNVGHLLMAVAMVGMLVPSWRTLPGRLWTAVFVLAGLWFFGRASLLLARVGLARLAGPGGLHIRHYAAHGVMAVAMVYMDLVGGPSSAHSGTAMAMGPSAGVPTLTLLFMVVLLASAVWQLNGIGHMAAIPSAAIPGAALAGRPGGTATSGSFSSERQWLAPRLEVGCHVVMCLAMAYMLVLVV